MLAARWHLRSSIKGNATSPNSNAKWGGIGDALTEIFSEAEASEESPLNAAERRVHRALQDAKPTR